MAKIDIVCPKCQSVQSVPTRRLSDPWVCLICRHVIPEPMQHRRKGDVHRLAIPLQGKIISSTGITNLAEIVADSAEYSKGFGDGPWDPTKMHVVDRSGEWAAHQERDRKQTLLLLGFVLFLIIGGGLALLFFVLIPLL